MKTAKKVVKNTLFLYLRMVITIFISLYSTRLILEGLGIIDFGIFNIVGGVVAMLGFLNASMSAASQRYMSFAEGSGDAERLKNVFNVSVVLHFILSLLIVIILISAGLFFFNGILNLPSERSIAAKWVYIFMIISTVFSVMTVPYDAVLNARENLLFYAVLGVLESLLKLLVSYLVIHTFYDKLIFYGALISVISLVIMVIKRVYCHNIYEECIFYPKQFFEIKLMKEMTSYAGWNLLTASISMITTYGMGIALNVFFGAVLNAAQGIANQISSQLSSFSSNMLKALAPSLTKRAGAGDNLGMLKTAFIGSKSAFMLNLLFMSPFIVEAPFVLSVWLVDVPRYAVLFSRLLLFNIILETFLGTLSQTLMVQGDIKKSTIARTLHSSLYLPLICLVFYLGFNPEWMYIIFIVKTVFSIIIVLFFNKINCSLNIRFYLKEVVFKCIFSAIILFVFLFIQHYFLLEGLFRMLLVSLTSVICCFFLFYFIVIDNDEKVVTKALIYTVKNKFK